MRDAIARTLLKVLSVLAPRRPGRHSSEHLAAQTPEPKLAPEPAPADPARAVRRTLRPLPERKSPYAHAAGRPFLDTVPPVRPYVLAPTRRTAPTEKEAAQAHRRWEIDMSNRGLDVGPDKIHGVHLLPGSRTIHLSTAA